MLSGFEEGKVVASDWSPAAWVSVDNNSDNNGVEADSWGENDDDEHADERWTVLRSNECGGGAKDTNTDSAD